MLPDKGEAEAQGSAKAVCSPKLIVPWLFPALGFLIAVKLGWSAAILVPDAAVYRRLAVGPRSLVPSPFSARILAPAAAAWLGRVTGLGVDDGFMILGVLCLAAVLVLVACLLRSQQVPAGILAAVFLMPFWAKAFHNLYLPDLLHAAILAALLLCLASGRLTLAMGLLFPAYLARESTLLLAICLGCVAWRRVPRRALLTGVAATVAGMLVSSHFVKLGAPNVEGVTGAPYILGKFVWSFSRNLLGVPLWTNTIPGCKPIWQSAMPHGLHLGAIHSIGFCPISFWGPGRILLAWFGVFGIVPAVAAAYLGALLSRGSMSGESWLKRGPAGRGLPAPVTSTAGAVIAFRFCIVYGLLTVILAPLLGASVDRLVEYAWPFSFVALAWFLSSRSEFVNGLGGVRSAGLLIAHLAAGWISWIGFSWQWPTSFYVVTGLGVLFLNVAAYFAIRRLRRAAAPRMETIAVS